MAVLKQLLIPFPRYSYPTMRHALPLLPLLALLALPQTVHAQDAMKGDWVLTFMMHEGASQTLNVNADVVQDSLQLLVVSDHGERPLESVSLIDEVLRFILDTGHGSIACTLYKKEAENLSGICEGPQGEIPTTMARTAHTDEHD